MRNILTYIMCYLLILATVALGFVNMLMVRSVVLAVITTGVFGKWAGPAVDKVSFVLIGLAWLVFALYVEHIYRESVPRGRLFRRFLRVTSLQLFFICGVYAVLFSLAGLGDLSWSDLIAIGGAGALGALIHYVLWRASAGEAGRA